MRGDALAGSTRLHRLHRHASEPSVRQETEVRYRRIAGVVGELGVHMCLPSRVSTITRSDHRRCVVRERLGNKVPSCILLLLLLLSISSGLIRMP